MEIKVTAKEIESMKESYLPVVDAICVATGMGKPERRTEEWIDDYTVGTSIVKDADGNITIQIKEDCVCDFTQQTGSFLMKIAAKLGSLMIFCKGLFAEIVDAFEGFEKKWGINESLLNEEQKKLLDAEMATWVANEIKFRQEAGLSISGIESAAEREREYRLHVLLGRVRDSEGHVVEFKPQESEYCHSRIR